MNRNQVKKKLIDELQFISGFPVKDIKGASKLKKDLKLDHMDKIELAMSIEEEVDIYLDEIDIENTVTVKDFIELVMKYIKKGKSK